MCDMNTILVLLVAIYHYLCLMAYVDHLVGQREAVFREHDV